MMGDNVAVKAVAAASEYIHSQRIGQIIVNALIIEKRVSNEDVHQVLFYMQDHELAEVLKRYIEWVRRQRESV